MSKTFAEHLNEQMVIVDEREDAYGRDRKSNRDN